MCYTPALRSQYSLSSPTPQTEMPPDSQGSSSRNEIEKSQYLVARSKPCDGDDIVGKFLNRTENGLSGISADDCHPGAYAGGKFLLSVFLQAFVQSKNKEK